MSENSPGGYPVIEIQGRKVDCIPRLYSSYMINELYPNIEQCTTIMFDTPGMVERMFIYPAKDDLQVRLHRDTGERLITDWVSSRFFGPAPEGWRRGPNPIKGLHPDAFPIALAGSKPEDYVDPDEERIVPAINAQVDRGSFLLFYWQNTGRAPLYNVHALLRVVEYHPLRTGWR